MPPQLALVAGGDDALHERPDLTGGRVLELGEDVVNPGEVILGLDAGTLVRGVGSVGGVGGGRSFLRRVSCGVALDRGGVVYCLGFSLGFDIDLPRGSEQKVRLRA